MGRLADGQAPHAMLAHIKSHMFDEDQTRLLIFNHARKLCRHARLPMRESRTYGFVRGARGKIRVPTAKGKAPAKLARSAGASRPR